MVDIRETDPREWTYVSEGGATIVFSYRGPPHADFSGTVLRLRKSALRICEAANVDGHTNRDDPTIEYQEKCIQKLIPPEYLPILRTVHLETSWLKKLVDLRNAVRPENRREMDEIDLTRTKGVLATDLVGGNCLAVEIKPKWGFLPSPTHLSEETKPIKTRTCRFCMHSYLKAQKGQEVAMDYCPLDLFSGDEGRITKAISSLWNAWVTSNGAINNLKVFARGRVIAPSEAGHMLKAPDAADLNSIRRTFTASLVRPLLTTPVLSILSRLERDLDSLDIEGLSKLWRVAKESQVYRRIFALSSKHTAEGSFSASPPGTMHIDPISMEEPSISDWIEFLDMYTSPEKLQLDHANPSPEHLKHYIMSYLLSATFKDCSIFVQLNLLDPSRPWGSGGPSRVTIIDLEPKCMKKFSFWEELDKDITHTYATQATHRKVCIDAGRQDLGN